MTPHFEPPFPSIRGRDGWKPHAFAWSMVGRLGKIGKRQDASTSCFVQQTRRRGERLDDIRYGGGGGGGMHVIPRRPQLNCGIRALKSSLSWTTSRALFGTPLRTPSAAVAGLFSSSRPCHLLARARSTRSAPSLPDHPPVVRALPTGLSASSRPK